LFFEKLLQYNKNKNSLEKNFLGMAFLVVAFLGNGIPWKNFSLEWHSLLWRSLEKIFLVVAFLETAFLGEKNSLEYRTAQKLNFKVIF
jgi:hypothetical protein